MSLETEVRGAAELAATALQVAAQLRAGVDTDQAGQEVIGYIKHPSGIPAGVARGLTYEATPLGFVISASGDAPFVTRFLTDPFAERADAVADRYAQQLEQLLTQLQGA